MGAGGEPQSYSILICEDMKNGSNGPRPQGNAVRDIPHHI